MRGAIGEHEGNGLAFLHFEIGDRGQILAVRLHGRAQHGHVLPTDREYRALLGSPDKVYIRAKAEADHQLHLSARVIHSSVTFLSAARSIAAVISSIASGSRLRQFGCSLTVPGILG